MKLGIVGGGAIGLTFAAALSRANDVIVLVRRPANAAAISRASAGAAPSSSNTGTTMETSGIGSWLAGPERIAPS